MWCGMWCCIHTAVSYGTKHTRSPPCGRLHLRSSKPVLPNKLHVNQANSCGQLIDSGRHQSLAASAMKCDAKCSCALVIGHAQPLDGKA